MALSLVSCSQAVLPRPLSTAAEPGHRSELSLLLKTAGEVLDQFWLLRAEQDIGLLLPDYLDPGHDCPLAGPPSASEAALRETLLRIGQQMRRIGLGAVTRAVLGWPATPRRQAALLALAGSAPWQRVEGRPEWRCRHAADGQHYILASEAGAGALHAPHAIRTLRQRLWVGRTGEAAPVECCEGGEDCLSRDLALRDVAVLLAQEAETELANAVLALCGAEAGGLGPVPALPAPARQRPAAA